MRAAASWSGGKDSALACYKSLQSGHEIACLLNFVSREYKRCCFHGIEAKLMKLQSDLIGIPIFQKEVTADMKEYEKEFKSAVCELKQRERIEGIVFGDVYLDEHRDWVERVCRELGVQAVLPLWSIPPAEVVKEFISAGFQAVLVSCKADLLGEEFVGMLVDEDFLNELQKRNICPCGENGEFHTFVLDGPLFRKRIAVTKSQPVLKKGFWEHWFLDIQEWEVRDK
jgi:uncharacterized protein (TIGR00290 family)